MHLQLHRGPCVCVVLPAYLLGLLVIAHRRQPARVHVRGWPYAWTAAVFSEQQGASVPAPVLGVQNCLRFIIIIIFF